MADADPLAVVVERAVDGHADALEDVCRALQDPIYRLAMRMFSHPEDAADATQEALIRVVTNLASFEARSKVTTWAYTIASRQFLRMKTQRLEATVGSADDFGGWIDQHRSEPSVDTVSMVEFDELCGDVRIACTYGMLLCLSRPVRLAYVLGDVIGLTDIEGAEACLQCLSVNYLDDLAAPLERGHLADWNTVDWYCVKVLGPFVADGDDMEERCAGIARWVSADSPWQRRSGAVAFVNHAATDPELFVGFTDLLLTVAEANVRHTERWSQTSVGWLLRELSRRCPEGVADFVRQHPDLSNEARTNAMKYLSC